jgi:LL-diaminopimelate aminotransferase
VVQALEEAAREQGRAETLKGYGPYVGYGFLRLAIAAHDFGTRGVKLGPDEIFVSDGGKSDAANIQELFAPDAVVALMDPAYPVYADANVMAGRSGPADGSGHYPGFVYLPCTAENDFQPALPDRHVDLIYLCYLNDPTGAVMTRTALRRWVDYARTHEAVIVYDAAYEAYIRDAETPRSIYEVQVKDKLVGSIKGTGEIMNTVVDTVSGTLMTTIKGTGAVGTALTRCATA